MKGEELLYTGDEFDEILNSCAEVGDWIELRKGSRVKGLKRRFLYRILEITKKQKIDGLFAKITDNSGKDIIVPLKKFKYITIKQREYVKTRIMRK